MNDYIELLPCPYCPRLFHSRNIRRMHLETFHADEGVQAPPFERSTQGWLAFLERMRAKAEAYEARKASAR